MKIQLLNYLRRKIVMYSIKSKPKRMKKHLRLVIILLIIFIAILTIIRLNKQPDVPIIQKENQNTKHFIESKKGGIAIKITPVKRMQIGME